MAFDDDVRKSSPVDVPQDERYGDASVHQHASLSAKVKTVVGFIHSSTHI